MRCPYATSMTWRIAWLQYKTKRSGRLCRSSRMTLGYIKPPGCRAYSIVSCPAMEKTPCLPRLFGPDILGKLPTTGRSLIRRTMLNDIGKYLLMGGLSKQLRILGVNSSWFTTQRISPPTSTGPNLLLSALSHIILAFEDLSLCSRAANGLFKKRLRRIRQSTCSAYTRIWRVARMNEQHTCKIFPLDVV
jgi:hypothetical protein